PVCSPRLLAGRAQLTPEDIAVLPLLQQTTRPYAWRQWFNSLGMRIDYDMTGPRLELFSMLAQAAMHDLGVALIPPFLIQEELDSGRLVAPCAQRYLSERAYYLIIPERKTETESLTAFRDWLIDTATGYRVTVGMD